MYRSEQAKTYADGRAEALWEPKPPNPTPSVFLLFRGIRMERCWCDEERAPCSTKREKVSALTEARSARRCIGLSKRRPMRMADPECSGIIQPISIL